jgi:DHA1 family tetracycline resistance protein-like MFS transporter
LPRQLAALFLFCILDTLGFGILIPLVPYMADRFGTPPQFITPILGSYSLCQLLAAPWWGRLSDRLGRRPVLMTSLAGACASYVLLGFARNVWWLLAARMLAGFMAGNIAAAFAYASDVSRPDKRAATLGLVGAAIGIGFTLGQPVGGLLAGADARHANFALPAAVSACSSLLAILLVRLVLPESHTPEHRRTHPATPRQGSWLLLRARPMLARLAAATLLVTYHSRSWSRSSRSGRCIATASGRAPWAFCSSASLCRRSSCRVGSCACSYQGLASDGSPLPARWPTSQASPCSVPPECSG